MPNLHDDWQAGVFIEELSFFSAIRKVLLQY